MHFKPVFVGTWYKTVALRRTLVKVRFSGFFLVFHGSACPARKWRTGMAAFAMN